MVLKEWPFFQSRARTTTNASTEKLTSAPIFHCAEDSANSPKAAPVFCTCVRWKKPGMTGTLSRRGMLAATTRLVMRSSRSTKAAIRKKYLRIANVSLCSA